MSGTKKPSQRTALVVIVGLSEPMTRSAHAPALSRFRAEHTPTRLTPHFPAVTCTSQACMLTGKTPGAHGVVGNGWYDRDLGEVHFWKQSNRLVRAPKIWDTARSIDPGFTCANLFWWFNMNSGVDIAATPRPIYKADGRKIPDCSTTPTGLRDTLQSELGRFPLFHFWGPMSSIASSRWIARAAKLVEDTHAPTLSLVYLPHLDYALQQHGPDTPQADRALAEIDGVFADLHDHFCSRGVRVLVCSEYTIERATGPVYINRALREAGLVRVRVEDGLELLDPISSGAFAIADHQAAHVYSNDPGVLEAAQDVCAQLDGVDQVLDRDAQRQQGIAHDRSGDLVLVASPGRWFAYPYWLDDARAPDFARTVDIHRKPGYDPAELFIDPALRFPRLHIARRLAQRKLGFRALLDVVPLDASLVRGMHGRVPDRADQLPILMGHDPRLTGGASSVQITSVHDVLLGSVFPELGRQA